ncbi:uncharacterized protein LOC109949841 isoform X1 [Prunus persica]|uniref:uncharacterized protein LOC109949841 isoform X1 n=1 Tax=Prunus persica TaxID=3760 RepID=UPI0009AB3F81|nr:uncharacterized protein LOC109949841 isoform X1 [Prunus persica]
MERYFKRKSTVMESSSPPNEVVNSSKQACLEINLEDLPLDPGLRTRIWDYHPNVRDQVRRAYLQKGPFQPRNHSFPQRNLSGGPRRFIPAWFDEFPTWLKYSVAKDAAYCFCCYLFKPNTGEQAGSDSFVGKGFSNWKKKSERLQGHVGGPMSAHNQAWSNCKAFSKQIEAQTEYKTLLGASVNCMRFLLRQGLLFYGDDEYEDSNNQGMFADLLRLRCNYDEDIKAVTLNNAPLTLKLTSSDTQKDIEIAISTEIINAIVRDIGDSLFSILIDEFHDMSSQDQMAIVLRFVDKGHVIERYLGIVQATDDTAVSLKGAIDDFFSTHGLSMAKLRGQGYGGTSNMQGELNNLKMLIVKANECAFYVHCFAHDLHSTLIAMSKNHLEIVGLFSWVAKVVNVVGEFVECRDTLREKHGVLVFEALNTSEILSEQGLNEVSSKFKTLISLFTMFSSVIDVLEVIAEFGLDSEQKSKARVLLGPLQSFGFIFSLHMMINILRITDGLSQALQKNDQDIVNAMNLVRVCKEQLQVMKESGWDSLLNEVSSFCQKHEIEVHNMDDRFLTRGKKRDQVITNMHYYRVELFCTVIDMQIQELNVRFTEMNTGLLLCVACLNPSDSFSAFDKQKLICLAQYYPNDFSTLDLMILEDQLEKYIMDMRSSIEFSGLNGIADLSQKMVETKKDSVFPLVYLLLTLALILPVATPRVDRVFSAMNIVKNRLRNRMEDERMKDRLIPYIETDILDSIDDEVIMQRFQNMKNRPCQL